MRYLTSGYWNYRADACTSPDMVHHITGINGLAGVLGQAGGGEDALCGIGPSTLSAVCSVSEYSPDIFKTAVAIAHEIGHHLAMDHESLLTSFMYESPVLQSCSNTLGTYNLSKLNDRLNRASCVNVDNNDPDESCPSCDNFIKITNMADRSYNINFGCDTSDRKKIYDLSTAITNNCVRDRKYSISITYNDNDVEIVEKSNNFKNSVPYNGGNRNALIQSDTALLLKGGADFSIFKIRIKGNGRHPQDLSGRTGTSVTVTYYLEAATAIEDTHMNQKYYNSSSLAVYFGFQYPFQLDKRGIPIVKASELKVPNQIDSLDFCFSDISKDIYIDGDFIIDINQSYCNTNFYFGPNAKVIVNENNSLDLNHSALTACEGRWQGIYLKPGAVLNMDNNSSIHHAVTGIEGSNVIVSLKKVDFDDNITAVKLIDASIEDCDDISISKGNYGLILDRCRNSYLNKVDISDVKYKGIRAENTSLFLSGCRITGTSKTGSGYGIESIGTGHVLEMNSNSAISTVSNWNVGINCLRNTMLIKNITFSDNFISITQTNSPGLTHELYKNTFSNCNYGFTTTNSTPVYSGLIERNTFSNVKYGISISNSINPYAGWRIQKCDFTNSDTKGIRLNNASGNNISYCNMQSKGLPHTSLISVSGGEINNIFNNYLVSSTHSATEAAQVKGIEIKGVAGISLSCNEVIESTYAYNYWGQSPGYFAHNISKNSHTGLYCGLYPTDDNAVMGVQEHYFNEWYNNSLIVGAKHLNSDQFYILLSQFIVTDDPNPNIYLPDPIIPNDKEWFVKNSTQRTPRSCSYSDPDDEDPLQRQDVQMVSGTKRMYEAERHYGLETASGTVAQASIIVADSLSHYVMDTALIASIVHKTIPYSSYQDEQEATALWQLYLLVQADSVLYSTNPNIATFMMEYGPTLYELYDASQRISGIGHYAVSGQRSLARRNATVINTAQQYAVDSLSAVTYQSERAQHLQDIPAAMTSLQSLTLDAAPWQYQRDLMMVLGRWQLTDSLSVSDINVLSGMADACPLYGGSAVYGARAVLETVIGEKNYDDHALCQPVAYRTLEANTVNSVSVMPNPAAYRIRITGTDIRDVQLMTVSGSKVKKQQESGVAEVEMDVSKLLPGIYMVRVVYGEQHHTAIKKLIILR